MTDSKNNALLEQIAKQLGKPVEDVQAIADALAQHQRSALEHAAPTAATTEAAAVSQSGRLVAISESNEDGEVVWLNPPSLTLGRDAEQSYPEDDYLSPQHARFVWHDDTLFVEDLDSINGTHLRVRSPHQLVPGDVFLMGREVMTFVRVGSQNDSNEGTRRMGSPPPTSEYQLMQVGVGGEVFAVHHLQHQRTVLGREPEVAEAEGRFEFPDDKYLNKTHCCVYQTPAGEWMLEDLGASNGTWIRVKKNQLAPGDHIFMGQQLFRVDIP